jgi:hypothetical protein
MNLVCLAAHVQYVFAVLSVVEYNRIPRTCWRLMFPDLPFLVLVGLSQESTRTPRMVLGLSCCQPLAFVLRRSPGPCKIFHPTTGLPASRCGRCPFRTRMNETALFDWTGKGTLVGSAIGGDYLVPRCLRMLELTYACTQNVAAV